MTDSDTQSLSEMTETICQLRGFDICRESWTFYYDETGNYRKISYTESGDVNPASLSENFILGGIMVTDSIVLDNIQKNLGPLASTGRELKFKSALGGGNDFLKILSRKETTTFLNAINQDYVYVHFSTQDNFFYVIVDIVESLLINGDLNAVCLMERQLKDTLYLCLWDRRTEFLKAAAMYGFPNIPSNNVAGFCNLVISYIQQYEGSAKAREEEIRCQTIRLLKGLLENAKSWTSLRMLKNNNEGVLVEGFSPHYTLNPVMFPKSWHVFDHEIYVERNMLKCGSNSEFVDSKDSLFVQLSDIWVGLISRLLKFLDERIENPDLLLGVIISDSAKNNLRTINDLIAKSDDLYPGLISNMNATPVVLKRYALLEGLATMGD